MTNYVNIAASIDGYIATQDGGIDWLPDISDSQDDYGFEEFLEKIDAIIMGRKTYEKVLSFGIWPYTKKVFVLTTSLREVPENLVGKVEYISGDIEEIVGELNNKGFKNLYIDGGQTIQSFLKKNMIDELIITRIPIILGKGIPLFGSLEKPIKIKEVETKVINKTIVTNTYKISNS